ncbi:hypothetical protein CBL_06167, partial [Carabus blaptoides fortunei]
ALFGYKRFIVVLSKPSSSVALAPVGLVTTLSVNRKTHMFISGIDAGRPTEPSIVSFLYI